MQNLGQDFQSLAGPFLYDLRNAAAYVVYRIGVDEKYRYAAWNIPQQPGCRVDIERSAYDDKNIGTLYLFNGRFDERNSFAEPYDVRAQLLPFLA